MPLPLKPVVPLLASLVLLGAACDGGDGDAPSASPSVTPTTIASPIAAVERQDLKACLADEGLAPEDAGLFIISSGGLDVEAMGLQLEGAGRVLLFVFPDDASGQVDYVSDTSAEGYADVGAVANVVVAFESAPGDAERSQVEGCITG